MKAMIAMTKRLAPLTQLALRFALATPFYRSGLNKWESFGHLSDTTEYLFREEFRLHLFGQLVPYPMPGVFAWVSAIVEILLPILLVLGLGTRWAALALLAMTAMIQITVPDGWANFHLAWAAMALALMTYGAGPLSLDYWLFERRSAARNC
ncbi:MAG: DoxX family protein [Nevskiaceae bacterium]|jgi:putative oxidoreductase|nr:DoxX family protein [Nevskiaceae bacterium]